MFNDIHKLVLGLIR